MRRAGRPDVAPIPPKSLLAAVDLSPVSLAAWAQARLLGAALGVPVEAVYVNREHPSVLIGQRRIELTEALRRRLAAELRARLGREASVHVLDGEPAEALQELLDRKPGHWLVMGAQGEGGLRRLALGSVAEALAVRPSAPVLTVRERPRGARAILAPVTSDAESVHGFQFAVELAWVLGASVTPLHVLKPGEDRGEAARLAGTLVRDLPSVLRAACRPAVLASGRVETAVVAAARSFDLVVLRADRAFSLGEALTGGTAEHVLRRSRAPVLVLPADAGSRLEHWGSLFGAAAGRRP